MEKDVQKIAALMEEAGPQFHKRDVPPTDAADLVVKPDEEGTHKDTIEWDLDPEIVWIKNGHIKSAQLYDTLSDEEREEQFRSLGLKTGIREGGSSFMPSTKILGIWEAPEGILSARSAEVAFKKISDPNTTVFNIVKDQDTDIWLVNYYEIQHEQ